MVPLATQIGQAHAECDGVRHRTLSARLRVTGVLRLRRIMLPSRVADV
jgi:hypothetical protein